MGEVANYVTAVELGLKRLETLPLSLRVCRELHGWLMKGLHRGTPGEFRRSQNWVGAPGCSLEEVKVSTSGAWLEWITFFLRGVRTQALEAVRRSEKLLALRRQLREKALGAGRGASLAKLVDLLFEHPAISIRTAQQALDVTFRAAQLNVDRLVALGLLEEVTGRERYRIYLARQIAQVAMEDLPDAEAPEGPRQRGT